MRLENYAIRARSGLGDNSISPTACARDFAWAFVFIVLVLIFCFWDYFHETTIHK